MEAESQPAGALGLTNFERFIAVVCWWQPFVALISLFFGSAPQSLKRHAKWSFITAVVVIAGAIVLGLLSAAVGALLAGGNGAAAGIPVAGVFGFVQGIAALINTIAIIANRGPYFRSVSGGVGGGGRRLR